MWPTTHLRFLHGFLQVIVDPGDDVGVEARQGKQGGGRGRGAKGVDLPGEPRPDPKGFIQEPVSFCKESTALLVTGGWPLATCSLRAPALPGDWSIIPGCAARDPNTRGATPGSPDVCFTHS